MKKIVSLVISLLVLAGMYSVTFGATKLNDIKNSKYEDAVEILINLNVVSGYPDNTYRPSNVVTRAEMAKMLVVALGQESEATKAKGATKFSDVPSGHWASGYINVATKGSVIKGYPDGSFAPEETVSYAEAVTMLVRALNYGEEVEKTGIWPTNYITKAKNLGVIDGVSITRNDDGALRGNVALLMWNTLTANEGKVTGENSSGLIYGKGQKLLNSKLSNYQYIEEGIITDVKISSNKTTITIKGESGEKLVAKIEDEEETELFGKEVNVLYDKKKSEFLLFEFTSNNKVVEGDVDKVSKNKIYIDDDAYVLPDDDYIMLYGIDDISDADTAYLIIRDGKVAYVTAFGEEEIYYGLVIDAELEINGEAAVKLMTLDGKETYILEDEDEEIEDDDVIIFKLNEDDELVVKDCRSLSGAKEVSSVSKTTLKLVGKSEYDFSDEDYIVIAADIEGGDIESIELNEIDEDYDMALVVDINDYQVVIVFINGLDIEEDTSSSTTVTKAKNRLLDAIEEAEDISSSKYTTTSYNNMKKYLTTAKGINTKTATASKMNTAAKNLEDAIDDLVPLATSVTTAKKNLNTKLKAAKALNQSDYTTTSYAKLTTAIKNGETVYNSSSSTVSKINIAINNLDTAMDGLVSVVTDTATKEAKAQLTSAINEAKALVKANYTTASYNVVSKALTAAQAINTSTASAREMRAAAVELENAIDALVTKTEEAKTTAKTRLAKAINQANSLLASDYVTSTWNNMLEVKRTAEALNTNTATAEQINAKAAALESAINQLISKEDEKVKGRLKPMLEVYIEKAKEYKTQTDLTNAGLTTTIAKLNSAVAKANAVLSDFENKTLEEVQDAYNTLGTCLGY